MRPLDIYDKLRCRFEGNDGDTSYTAETGQIATFYGNSKITTEKKKWGNSGLSLPGDEARIEFPASSNWNIGSNDFTIEFWFNYNALPSGSVFKFVTCMESYGDSQWGVFLGYEDSEYGFYWGDNTPYFLRFNGNLNSLLTLNTWHHHALVKQGSTWRFFLNGQQIGPALISPHTIPYYQGVMRISAGQLWAHEYANGYMDDLNISNGIARYTENFIPAGTRNSARCYLPVSRENANENIYLRFEGSEGSNIFTDIGSRQSIWTPYKGAYITNVEKKAGNGSGVFYNNSQDGYLSTPDSSDWNTFWNNDFTVDAWVYPTSGDFAMVMAQLHPLNWVVALGYEQTGGNNRMTFVFADTDGVYRIHDLSAIIPLNQWNHMVWKRTSDVIEMFLNEISLGTLPISYTVRDIQGPMHIGGMNETPGYAIKGYLDEVKVSF